MYIIKNYTFDRLKELNDKLKTDKITIKPSKMKNKKISVFINDNKVADIGAVRDNGEPYMDYPSYIEQNGKAYADERRKLYLARHNDPHIKDGKITNQWYSSWFLW